MPDLPARQTGRPASARSGGASGARNCLPGRGGPCPTVKKNLNPNPNHRFRGPAARATRKKRARTVSFPKNRTVQKWKKPLN